jgi:HD-GYP domain-containing protein (c-di-GMP phosphodiesterase class II)
MGREAGEVERLRLAGEVHDVGRIVIARDVTMRAGALTDAEWATVRRHSLLGAEIVADLGLDWPLADIVAQHHERHDGSGYPSGLRGEEIVPEARIIAVADVVDAMTSARPHRPAHDLDAALGEIGGDAGARYDPEAAQACLAVFEGGFELSD